MSLLPDYKMIKDVEAQLKRLKRLFTALPPFGWGTTPDQWVELTEGLAFGNLLDVDGEDYFSVDDVEQVEDPSGAEVVTSLISGDPERPTSIASLRKSIAQKPSAKHKILLDVDMPVVVIPSSTPGHHHLYIDKELSWPQYRVLLEALGKAGVVEEGYLRAAIHQKFTTLRTPWTKKQVSQPIKDDEQ